MMPPSSFPCLLLLSLLCSLVVVADGGIIAPRRSASRGRVRPIQVSNQNEEEELLELEERAFRFLLSDGLSYSMSMSMGVPIIEAPWTSPSSPTAVLPTSASADDQPSTILSAALSTQSSSSASRMMAVPMMVFAATMCASWCLL